MLTPLRTTVCPFRAPSGTIEFAFDSVSKDLKLRVVFSVKGGDFIRMSNSVVHNCPA